ncbi:MAG: uracil-DNA glycosylase [Clostridia bacterium]|nr:uracil-DNA glycosylase [Clostridia bacterium]
MVNLGNSWDALLREEFEQEYYLRLRSILKQEYSTHRVYPDMHDIFNALRYTPYESVKAVILGQDPYHGPNQAHGLCFSVKKGVVPPPSLKNIFQEIQAELGIAPPDHGQLTDWAEQGVLMLNTTLTVREHQPLSHKGLGWEIFTDKVISLLNERETPMVFLLWGAPARKKKELITNPNHLVLTAAHPSPLSAYQGFFGCGHFKTCNDFLQSKGISPINWALQP